MSTRVTCRVPLHRQCKTAENFKCALVRQEAETSLGLDFYAWAEASAGEAAQLESKLDRASDGNNGDDDDCDDDDDDDSESDGKRRSSKSAARGSQGSQGSRRSQQKQSEMRTRSEALRNDALAYFQVSHVRERVHNSTNNRQLA